MGGTVLAVLLGCSIVYGGSRYLIRPKVVGRVHGVRVW